MKNDSEFRLIDFKVSDVNSQESEGYIREFSVQMFGINEKGEDASIRVNGIQPFFYIKVGFDWVNSTVKSFQKEIEHILSKAELKTKYNKWKRGHNDKIFPKPSYEECSEGEYIKQNYKTHNSYAAKGIYSMELVEKHKLYGFDNHSKHNFVKITFINNNSFNKVRNVWFDRVKDPDSRFGFSQILKTIQFRGCETELYEAKLPPLLRFFHINNISPSGWIKLIKPKIVTDKTTICKYEYNVNEKDIIPLNEKEVPAPIKICSFDIEASSSHGDFPMAKKTYKKLAGELQIHWTKYASDVQSFDRKGQLQLLKRQIYTAFDMLKSPCDGISNVFPKDDTIDKNYIDILFQNLTRTPLKLLTKTNKTIDKSLIPDADDDDDDDDGEYDEEIMRKRNFWGLYVKYNNDSGGKYTFIDCLLDNIDVAKKVDILDAALTKVLPSLEGDMVTFIGSTFMLSGQSTPYLNHGVCLTECNAFDIPDSEVEIICCDDERDVLIEWTNIIRREKPDVIIGYNIFGFDYKFMCDRAEETDCEIEFYQLGKNKYNNDYKNEEDDEEREKKRESLKKELLQTKKEKELRIASGSHELTYIDIDGIIQIDLYNYFRREVNLASYKLQDVASHFIGDMVNETLYNDEESKTETTVIKSKNLMGLQNDNYVIFEVIGHSLDPYEGGQKFKVIDINETGGDFTVEGIVQIPNGKKMRWGLGKDDVSPADLFHAFSSEGTIEDRTTIARYCFQDCNLVHHLLRKNDVLTGISEIASICYVPTDFIIMRGQGIKLLSFIAKKCSEKNTLMPVTERKNDGGYEGAICLPPKRGFYSNKPTAVVDYASLYPSSMISENISHDSKVWTKEYNSDGALVKETGNHRYDNLPGFKYVDIEYDTYEYEVPEGKTKEEKVKKGTKVCRFAQFPNNNKAIMPSILVELLAARKATRQLIKYKTLSLEDGEEISGALSEDDDNYYIKNKSGKHSIPKKTVIKKKDTYSDFMKNVFNQRQLGYKVTANSLYGQCGAKTSAFYEKDIAASTTATGRKLLIYAKKVIEGVYKNRICDTKHGKVTCVGDVVYGDTDSCFFVFNPKDENGNDITGKKALEITIELAIQAGELASKFLKAPHDLEYEKTFEPFLLLSKKRYVGMLYEHDSNKCKRKSMGIVLKRRDNADVVKDIYGGVIDILMNEGDIPKAIRFTKQFLQNIIDGKIDMKKLIITKALRGWYKVPQSIAHKVLADRMGKRDPGNKPSVGSRIPYIYIQTKGQVKLQGDKIEHPDYIREHDLKPDYSFYITNQIMKPLMQIFALVLEQIPEFKHKLSKFKRQLNTSNRKYKNNEEKRDAAEEKLRNAEVKKLIFDDTLRQAINMKLGQQTIKNFFH